MKKNDECVDDAGTKRNKGKFYKPAGPFPHIIFILLSSALFLRLTDQLQQQTEQKYTERKI